VFLEVPREFLRTLYYALRQERGTGLSDDQLRERLDKLREFRILPKHRTNPNLEQAVVRPFDIFPTEESETYFFRPSDFAGQFGNLESIGGGFD
jgi:hypothetical protein